MKKLIINILLFTLIIYANSSYSQTLALSGKIQYEKSINKFAFIEKDLKNYSTNMAEDFLKYKSSNPQFLTLKSTLTFSENQSLFSPLPDDNPIGNNYWNGKVIDEQINIVFNDFVKNETIIQKEVLGENYLINDQIRPIKWKITDQTREIAGYNCRRANGVIMDSIYVVAFYTGEIPVQAGPESFSGLPGMILGVALPYENVSWFATKVDLLPEKTIQPPFNGKPTTYKELFNTLVSMYKPFKNGKEWIKRIMY